MNVSVQNNIDNIRRTTNKSSVQNRVSNSNYSNINQPRANSRFSNRLTSITNSHMSRMSSNFNTKIAEGQVIIENIEKKGEQLEKAKKEVERSVGSLADEAASSKVSRILKEVEMEQEKMKGILEELNAQLSVKMNSDPNDPELRVHQNLFGSLIKRYKNICVKFKSTESEIKSLMEDKVIRSAEIALNRNLTSKEQEDVLQEPKLVQKMIEKELTGAAPVQLKNAVNDIEERHKDIKRLEMSIVQMHNMINELNLMVQRQGEMVDNIEQNIQSAKSYVQKAETNITQAKENMEATRRRKCIILSIIIGVLVVILLIIVIVIVT